MFASRKRKDRLFVRSEGGKTQTDRQTEVIKTAEQKAEYLWHLWSWCVKIERRRGEFGYKEKKRRHRQKGGRKVRGNNGSFDIYETVCVRKEREREEKIDR